MKRARALLACVTLAVLPSSAAAADTANNWPSLRGPLHTGVAPGGAPPLEWSEEKNVRWKVALPGPGHATPIVWGDRIYVLSAVKTDKTVEPEAVIPASWQERDQPQRSRPPRRHRQPRVAPTHIYRFIVSAIDRATGTTVWETVVREEVPHEPGHSTSSRASATPVTDGKHVYAFFGSRGLYCLDMKGKVVWDKDFGDMKTRNQFGEGASPALSGDTLVIQWDHEGDSFIAAFDKNNGDERWRVPRDEPSSWSTPLIVKDGKREIVVASGTNKVRGYDLKSGKEIWGASGLGLNCAPTPVTDGELVFVMSGYREAAGMAIRFGGATGDISGSDRIAWRIEQGTSYVPSPLLLDGKLYFLERFKGMLSSYDLKSGEAVYTQQRIEGLGNIYASLVAAGGRIYVLDRAGTTVVFKPGATFEVLATNKLDDGFDATPVIVGKNLYLRGHEHLYNVAAE